MTSTCRGIWSAVAPLAAAFVAAAATTAFAQDDPTTDLEAAVDETIDEILVTGRRTPDGVPVVPLNAIGSRDVLGPERVKEIGAREMNDLIVNLPAISTRPYNGGEASAPSFSMRGLPDDGLTEYIHVLIDGVPASPLQYGWTAFSFLPITVERVYAVDYIRGAHSVRYSPNTVGGILNFVTEPIPVEPMARFRQSIGNFGYSSSTFSVGGTQDGLGAIFTVVDRQGDGYRDDGDFSQTDWNAKLRLDIDECSWVAGSVSYFDDEHQAPGGLTLAEFDDDRWGNTRPRNSFDGDRTAADVVYHVDTDDGWIEGFSYWSETNRHLFAQRPQFGKVSSYSDWTDTSTQWALGFRIQHTVEFAGMKHTLFGGARYHDEAIPAWRMRTVPLSGGPGRPTLDNDLSLDAFSMHLDDTFQPIEKLTVTAGLRWEDASMSGKDPILGFDDNEDFDDVLPGIGASYETTENSAVFANYFEGFRAPQVWGVGEKAAGHDLKFERSDSTEVGFRFRDVNGFTGSITWWRARFDDFGVFYTGFYENLGKTKSDGFDYELGLDLGTLTPELQGFSVWGSMTTQDAELRSGPDAGNDMPYSWDKKASWTVRYESADRISAAINGTYVGRSYSDEANTGFDSADGTLGVNPSRTLWDGRVAKVFELSETTELELAAGVTNATDHEWFVHSRGGFFGGGKVAGAPRQTYMTVGLTVNW